MNLLNRLGRLVLSIIGATVLVCISGCDLLGNLDVPVQEENDVVVTLRLDEAFQTKAHVRLNHDGSQEAYWYYMLTQDLAADADQLLADQIQKAVTETGVLQGNVGTNKNITFENLLPKTTYRVIAAIVSPQGEIVGDVATMDFVTLRDPEVFEVWPAWEISYKERLVSPNDPNKETEVFTCKVEGDTTQTYIPCILSKDDFEKYYVKGDDIKKDLGKILRRCFEDYVDYRNSVQVKWMNEVKNQSFEYTQERLLSGKYMMFMIGIDATGTLTGYYAQNELDRKQEEAFKAYDDWAGTWTLKGECMNRAEDGSPRFIEYTIDIVPTETNLYYELYGYDAHTMDSLEEIPYLIPLKLYFEKSSGDIYVISETLPDYPNNQGLADLWDFYAYGSVEVIYGGVLTVIPVDIENLTIARFSLTDSSHAKGYNTDITIDLYGESYDTQFVAFNYFYQSLGLFNYILKSADHVLRTETITLVKTN